MMNKAWTKTSKALEQIFSNFNCSVCKKGFHDPPKFRNCGHLLCRPCSSSKNTSCAKCQSSQENDDILNNETIYKIVQCCCIIAEEIGFRQDHNENVNVKAENVSFKEQLESTPSLSEDKNLKNNNDQDSKQADCDRGSTTFHVPKNVNKTNHFGETKLQQIIKKGNIENIKALLDAGANPNVADYAKWTPLQESVDFNYYEVSKLLLERGANVNQPGFEGRTPLHEAAKNDNTEMIILLLKYKANKETFDDSGKRPVDYCQLEEIKKLLNCDEDIQIIYEKKENDKGNEINNFSNYKDSNSNAGISKNA